MLKPFVEMYKRDEDWSGRVFGFVLGALCVIGLAIGGGGRVAPGDDSSFFELGFIFLNIEVGFYNAPR
jgi:hypothetical protein